MLTLKKYIRDGFVAITSLGSLYFHFLLVLFILALSKFKLAAYLAAGFIISTAFVAFLKLVYFKERPEKEDYFNLFTKINASSFPSLHAMNSMYASIVLANTINKTAVTIFLVLIALLIGYSRIYLKKHYFIDVLVGFILGIILGVIYLSIV